MKIELYCSEVMKEFLKNLITFSSYGSLFKDMEPLDNRKGKICYWDSSTIKGKHINKKMLYNENIEETSKGFSIKSLPSEENNLDEIIKCQTLSDMNKDVKYDCSKC